MKKPILFFAILFFALLTTESYAQRAPLKRPKPITKTEETKNQAEPVKPIQTVQVMGNPKILAVNPKVLKAFNSEAIVLGKRDAIFKVIGKDFIDGDFSTISSFTDPKSNQFCTTTNLFTNLNTADFKDFTTNGPPDWLKPGIIMDAVGFLRGEDQIESKYNRGAITIASTAPAAPLSKLVIKNPKDKSNITEAIGKLLSKNNNLVYGANMSYSYTEIQTVEELNVKINGRFKSVFGNIASELDMKSSASKSYHYYLVEFQQSLYNLEVDELDKTNIFPDNPDVDLSKYVYISKVNYGRRGYFMFKSEKSITDFGASTKASASYAGVSGAIKANLDKIAKSNSTEVTALYYGGTNNSAATDIAADWKKNGRKPLEDYIAGYNFTAAEAYPISYEMKNLDNQRVGMTNKNSQTIKTCVESKNLKLKVTLMQIQSSTTQDSDNIADYGITQHVRYEAYGKTKTPIKIDFNKFKDNTKCNPAHVDEWLGATALICGSKEKQIPVTVSKVINGNRSLNIDNSVIFEISPQEANDTNAQFSLDTWVKEYSKKDIVMDHDPRKTKVAIHDVLAILTGIKKVNYDKSFIDGSVDKSLEFHNFNGGFLPLRNVSDSSDKVILEGPIRARNRGSDSEEKAFVWMKFELID